MKPRLLDAFCCAGGASRGYQRAGFHVTGVDIADQPDYCGDDFYRGDAVAFILEHGHDFDAIAASPPCQDSTALTRGNRMREGWIDDHVDLIPATRGALEHAGRPYVIENVQGSSLRRDLVLCGLMFGLQVFRHRYFELGGWAALCPPHPPHRGHRVAGWRHGQRYDGDMFAVYGDGGGKGSVAEWQAAMGIDWTSSRLHLAEAIPPAFTEFIGVELLERLRVAA